MSGLQQRTGAFDRRCPLLWDLGLAAGVAVISLNVMTPDNLLGLALFVLVHAVLAIRRRRPAVALAVAAAALSLAGVVALSAGLSLVWVYLGMWILLFNTGLRRPLPPVPLAGIIAVTTAAGAFFSESFQSGFREQVTFAAAVAAMCTASYLLGLQIRGQREQRAAERREAAHAAVVAERSRIAQEMHDIIGHNLSVISSLSAGGAAAARTSPEEAARAFGLIGEVSRSSSREVRRVLEVLRHDLTDQGASLNPQPGVGELSELVEAIRAAGLPVSMERSGDLAGLSPNRQLVVYRTVQEALTNTLRHAGPGTHAAVTVRREGTELVVEITDAGGPGAELAGSDLPGPEQQRRPEGAQGGSEDAQRGSGLLGMRERVEAYGGTLLAGPSVRGWRVLARLPLEKEEAP